MLNLSNVQYSHVMSEDLQTIAVHSDVRDWYGGGKGGGASRPLSKTAYSLSYIQKDNTKAELAMHLPGNL